VTAMDRRSEALITSRIRAHRPGDAVLGEEGGQTSGGPAGDGSGGGRPGRVRWVVDPLDGTVNYLYGLHDWAVSIAAEVDGTVVAGVVEVPRRGETFTAVAGQGAWLHRGEARVALTELFKRIRGYEVDEANAVRVHSSNVRGFARLPMTVEVG